MNKGGRGIRIGLGFCSCTDMMVCTCGNFQKGNGGRGGSGSRKEEKEGPKLKKDRDIMPVVSDARKGELNEILSSSKALIKIATPEKRKRITNNKSFFYISYIVYTTIYSFYHSYYISYNISFIMRSK